VKKYTSRKMPKILMPLALILGVVLAWEAVARAFAISSYLVPAPSLIADKAIELRHQILGDIIITSVEALLGFALGSAAAILLAVLLAHNRTAEHAVMPLAIALKAVPIVAIAPLLLIWFGFGAIPKILLAAFICFFPVLVGTTYGFKSVDINGIELFASLSATKWQMFKWLAWPSALGTIFAALRTAIVFAVIGAVVAELAGATRGIGFKILIYSYQVDTPGVFVYVILSGLVGILLFYAVVWLGWKIVYWEKDTATPQGR